MVGLAVVVCIVWFFLLPDARRRRLEAEKMGGRVATMADSESKAHFSSRVRDHPSSGTNQGKFKTNQPQLTPAQDYERKRKFCEPRSVSDNQAVAHGCSGVKFALSLSPAGPGALRMLQATAVTIGQSLQSFKLSTIVTFSLCFPPIPHSSVVRPFSPLQTAVRGMQM